MALVPLHGRDHCPTGPDPIPCLSSTYEYARFQRINSTNITVNDATNVAVTGTADDVNTDTSIFQVNANSEIQMLVDGLIGIWAQTVWSTYDTTFRQVGVWNTTPAVDVILAMGGSSNDLYDPIVVAGIVRVVTGTKLKLIVNQHSGGGQSLYGGGTAADEINFLEVQYLGPYGS